MKHFMWIMLLIISYCVCASEMDDVYQQTIAGGATSNQDALTIIQQTDTSQINTNVQEVNYKNQLGDEASSKSFALSNPTVQKQYDEAIATASMLEPVDEDIIAQGDNIASNPDQHTSNEDYCTDSDCVDIQTANHTADMVQNAAILNDVLGGAQSYANSGAEVSIYSGKAYKCKESTGFPNAKNCCANTGFLLQWGSECSDKELELAEQKEQNLCHRVGDYKNKIRGPFGVTVRVEKYQGYCCFPSEMAYLTHKGGRGQFNPPIDWGSGKSPVCRGFTPDEFAHLDFSKIDLSAIYDDIEKSIIYQNPDSMLAKPHQYVPKQGIASW